MREQERRDSIARAPWTALKLFLGKRYSFDFDLMPIELREMSLRQRINLMRHGLNLIHRRTHPWSWPIHMQVELTNFCDLRCPICPTGSGSLDRPAQAIDVDLFETLMREVGPYLLTLALYAWGEPLLHPRLARLLEIATRTNAAVLLSTNGQALDQPGVAEALVQYPPAHLIVAIDGLTDETNSHFRVGAKLERILRGVGNVVDARGGRPSPILHMRYLVMKHNQHEVPRVRDFAERHGFDFLSIRTLSPIDSSEAPYEEFIPISEDLRAFGYERDRRVQLDDFVCMHAFGYPTVFADGTVVACEQDFGAKQPYGALSGESTFADVWFGENAARIRRTIRDTPSSYSFCRNCPFVDRPVSSCSVAAYDLHAIGRVGSR